jgi:hypothetical protein
MISFPTGTPVFKDSDELALRDIWLGNILRHVTEPKAGHGAVKDLEDAVEDKLTLNAHSYLSAVSLELPRIQSAMGRKP